MTAFWLLMGLGTGAFVALSHILLVKEMTPNNARQFVILTGVGAGSRWLIAAVLLLLALLEDSVAGCLFAFVGLWLARWVIIALYLRQIDAKPKERFSQVLLTFG